VYLPLGTLLLASSLGCSSGSNRPTDGGIDVSQGSGGTPGSSGTPGSDGGPGSGGTSGSGGASGGVPGAGGVTTSTGGAVATGGTTNAAGTPATGGMTATGGTTGFGGTTSAGGVTSTAGSKATGGTTGTGGITATGGTSNAGGANTPVYGVTADDITNLSGLVDSLRSLPHKPTTRIVFDEGQSPSYYAQAVPAVHAVSFVMGEILDSAYVAQVSVADYSKRTGDYLAAFPTTVDIWEVGNEINGDWLDTTAGGAADVAAKMTAAFDLVVAAAGRTALTLYGCSDSDAKHDMMTWTSAHVPARMLAGLDYVLVSYYEGDCGTPRSDWPAVFHQLRQLFPKAQLGFGECGAVDANGQDIATVNVAGPYLQRYYGMQIAEPGYIGGYFWWYFYEDMVPKTKPMFSVLSSAIQ
jgi:hypothetical protein